MADLSGVHDELRPLMFSIAYRMLGSVTEAEDVVQESFLRMHQRLGAGDGAESPAAYATTVTTRLAIDALRSARRRRERHVGPWLPEPLPGTDDADPAHRIELDETVSLAFLVVLERLSPAERAVFVLREVLDYEYADIAHVVDKSEANCRQLLARARRRIDEARPRFEPSTHHHAALTRQFLTAVREGDVAGLEELLAADVVFHADGGGKAPAIGAPMHGRARVARFLTGLFRRGRPMGVRMEATTANGQPALRLLTSEGALLGVLGLAIVDGEVVGLRNQINPDKLAHLGRVGDLTAMMTQARTPE